MGYSAGCEFDQRAATKVEMIPEIFRIGPIPINSFGLMIALALFAAIYRLAPSFAKNEIDPKLAERYVMAGGLSGLLGARIWFLLTHWQDVKGDPIGAIFSSAGFVFYGGFIFAAVVLYIMSKRDKIPIANFVNSIGPCLILGYGIGRLGCQLSGDGDYGMLTDSVLGMSYHTGVIPTPPGTFAYPAPLYESIMSFMILWVLTIVENRRGFFSFGTRRFGLYLALIAVERFLIEFIRINPKTYGPLSEAHMISIVFCLCGLACMISSRTNESSHAVQA